MLNKSFLSEKTFLFYFKWGPTAAAAPKEK
jgi:hypothetical protein